MEGLCIFTMNITIKNEINAVNMRSTNDLESLIEIIFTARNPDGNGDKGKEEASQVSV